MTSRRSYLETLNSGRQRRGNSSLDDLTRTLEALETQLERPSPFADLRRRDASDTPADYRPQVRADGRPHAYDSSARAAVLQSVARDFERSRREGEGVAAVEQIAAELQMLREDMRHQMAAALTSEFDVLRNEVHRIASEADRGGSSEKLLGEVERLSGAIADLSQRSDDKNVALLRLELEQVKAAVSPLAREDTLRAVGNRWDEFDSRMAKFEEHVAAHAPQAREDGALEALTSRLEQIAAAVDILPESLSLRTMEEKVRTLAGALDHFARKQDAQSEQSLEMIGERLDEISRAIAASVSRAQIAAFDPAPFQRIEARMASLAGQIEELTEERPATEVLGQLASLSARVDDLAARSSLPEKAVERLGAQLGMIAERLEREPVTPDVTAIFEGLEQRFATLSDALDRRQSDSMEQGNKLLRDLETRLDTIVERLDIHAEDRPDAGQLLTVMDERFAELAARLDERVATGPEAASIRDLETRLGDIATRLDTSAKQVSGVDESIIGRLEAQVAELSVRLTNPARLLPELDNLAPRFNQIERSIAGQHDQLIEAARNAAADAVRELADRGEGDPQAVASLSDELRALEVLTRKSDERNSKTFEAIHDTLIKIVDRLSTMEHGDQLLPASPQADTDADTGADTGASTEAGTPTTVATSMPLVADAPSIAADDAFEPDTLNDDLNQTRSNEDPFGFSPAKKPDVAFQTPVSAPQMPVSSAEKPVSAPSFRASVAMPSDDKRSKLGGFTKALRGRKDKQTDAKIEPEAATSKREEPAIPSLDQPLDPRIANQPLEPGSGAPDLNAIMKRVRDERGPAGGKSDAETAKSDFIAAARRAAQAAAAEAVVKKRGGETEGSSSGGKLGRMLGLRRKTVLMATVAMAVGVGGLQLGRAFLGGDNVTIVSDASRVPASDATENDVASAEADDAITGLLAAEQAEPASSSASMLAPAEASSPQQTFVSASNSPLAAQAATAPVAEPAVESEPLIGQTDEQPEAAPAMQPQAALPAPVAPAANETLMASAPLVQPEPLAGEQTIGTIETVPVPVTAGPAALREAAEAGDEKAWFEIGTRYAEGRNGDVDMKTAAEWYQRAADRGLAPAQYRIGNFYEKGLGVERDLAKAKAFYQASAEQGNASAMHNLAVLNAMGADGAADNKTAARWFTEAAEHGVKDSQFNLGILAAKGVGMNQDLEASYKWFALVAKAGDKDAEAKRDEIAKALKPEELTRARADTALWQAKAADPGANDVAVPAEWQESQETTASVDMKQAIKNIQLILTKNGFDAGQPDGMMGAKTKNAIIAFQSANGLTADGEVNEPLVRALLAKK